MLARALAIRFLSFAFEFIDLAIRLENINEGNNPRSYIKFLTSNSSRMVNCFLDMSKVVDYPSVTNQKYGDDYKKIFDDLAKYLQSITDLVKSIISIERESRKEAKTLEKEKIMREQKSRAVEFIPSDKDVKRLSLIEQTNAFYKEFCDDFLRDLDKQYSLSSKDMYEYFINVKFKNFVERYPMPIASDASEGYAKEVYCQIQILIDYISKISENSYAISAYKQK